MGCAEAQGTPGAEVITAPSAFWVSAAVARKIPHKRSIFYHSRMSCIC